MAPMPAEKSAYALARYSRSADSVAQSLEWVNEHDSGKFLDSFYFQYGHASIADLGHCIFCFEGISEIAAIEIADEQLWDGQAKSSRYQDFSKGQIILPDELIGSHAEPVYRSATSALLEEYRQLHGAIREHLAEVYPKPAGMRPGAYRRTIDARAYDVTRYMLVAGISTNIGQITSIRTLEKQMRRMGVSEYAEVRSLAAEMHAGPCAAPASCSLDASAPEDPVAPTLAKYADPDVARSGALERVAAWARQNFDPGDFDNPPDVDLVRPADPLDEMAATWLYAVTDYPFRVILEAVTGWNRARRMEVLETALQGRDRRDELMLPFRGGYRYVFDIVCDIGAYRDLHRHRRCQQVRQRLGDRLGCERPDLLDEAGIGDRYDMALAAVSKAREAVAEVSGTASHYLLPFAARCRSLFKMDFAEAEYIARVRSGVKGHVSYRRVAWEIRQRILEVEPDLGRLIHATPPWEEDALKR